MDEFRIDGKKYNTNEEENILCDNNYIKKNRSVSYDEK